MYLALNNIVTNLKVAKRLSPVLAFRYHALPVAEENNCITVAMAYPENQEARQAVLNELGEQVFIVKCDQVAIDAILKEIWKER